jgi:eukaryotic-like serine/threonine-protein kinase
MAVDAARAKSLFLAASELTDPAVRAVYLDRECGSDADLRGRVETLLRANDAAALPPAGTGDVTVDSGARDRTPDATGAHTPPPNIAGTTDFRPQVEPGLIIAGRYTLIEKIGEGGMGEVWVAKQTEPVKRNVALKLIKSGMDSKAVLARFEQERQALAMMDHPNIARVLDGGLTPTGQPFFVMDLVNGVPLNKFCDKMKLTPRERLELFGPICQAVQHAHQKGIIHRDLKPANILVTLIDAKPAPKVIDFGVAKATAGKLTDESMSTQFGAVVGTLEYMSPEQAGFSGEDIDTRADIYSLGVILYELLTGLKPLDAKRLRKAALTEMIRIIREEEPSKPSTRLSTNESLPSLAALRQTEPKKLMALLRGELDWVVMKCLEKQRERRYETANGLARDIQRYLADEVVEARPPSAGYRLRKFVRRHKGQVIAASLILIALLAGIIGTTWQAFRAELARADEAKQRVAAEDNLRAATIARKKEEIERKKAEVEKVIREEQGILALSALRGTSIYVDNYLRNKSSLAVLRLEIQKVTLRDLEKLSKHMAEHPLSGRTEAGALQRIGDVYLLTNRVEEAHQEYLKAEKVLIRFMKNNENDPVGPRNLAAITNTLGDVDLRLGDTMAARDRYAKALALRQQWFTVLDANAETRKAKPNAEQSIAESHTLLGGVSLELGDPVAAIELVFTL